MSWNIFETVEFVLDFLDLFFGNPSSGSLSYDDKFRRTKKTRKTKYLVEKISSVFIIIALILLFIVFKDPLPAENYVQTLIVASLIGVAVSMIFFFILHTLEFYHFKNIFQWLFFSCSAILFCISVVLCIYFESGLF
ncbi:hypothetical protein [Chryseobacterium populi]|uniref:Branched-chain amino acid ABC transporter substrate-binding protein n=1 Tax=Chryseobacterium populi TaxID=1144316 RepID=J3CJV7_9FLAO|nr:hypothetical protein [Chryseobacterium populi]EJL72981.1 hypothetical protein PMI13_01689 [Chryseobacterium populi]